MPRISRAVAASGRSSLRVREAIRLLRASLDPGALLDRGMLRDYLATLSLVLRVSQSVAPGSGSAATLLYEFDVTRFGVLAVEACSGRTDEEGPSGSRSGNVSSAPRGCPV